MFKEVVDQGSYSASYEGSEVLTALEGRTRDSIGDNEEQLNREDVEDDSVGSVGSLNASLFVSLDNSDTNANFKGSYNIPPTSAGVIIYVNRSSESASKYIAETLKFGVLPEWAKPRDPEPVKKGSGLGAKYSKEVQNHQSKLFNCRRETLAQNKSVWTLPRAHSRCVVPITGYFEWLTGKNGDKTPYYVHSESPVLFLAGLFSHNTNYNSTGIVSSGGSDYFSSFTIITGPAEGQGKSNLRWLHSRKPIFLEPFSKEWFLWLDNLKGWDDSLLECLNTDTNPVYDLLKWYPVTSRVGNPKNNGSDVINEVKMKQLSISLFFTSKKRKHEESNPLKHEESSINHKEPSIKHESPIASQSLSVKPEESNQFIDEISKRIKIEHQGSETSLLPDQESDSDSDSSTTDHENL